jgi:hypothetical protein
MVIMAKILNILLFPIILGFFLIKRLGDVCIASKF